MNKNCPHILQTGYCQVQMAYQKANWDLPYGSHLECSLCKDCPLKNDKSGYLTELAKDTMLLIIFIKILCMGLGG